MYNLLIVDDEPIIVEGLATINWNELEITKVYKATSGEQALETIKNAAIDIVITDIRMPDMTGLELIKNVQKGKTRKYIILSGYAEFEYAKEALDLSVCSYLLKPADDDEIILAVRNAIESLKEDRNLFFEMMNHLPIIETELQIEPFEALYKQPQLIDLMNYGDWEEVEKRIHLIFEHLNTKGFQSPEFLLQAYFFICNTFIYFSTQQGYLLSDVFKDSFQTMHKAVYSGSVSQLKVQTMEILKKLIKNAKKERGSNNQSVVEQVNNYVEENLHEDIYLQEVANLVFLHPVYLSKVYKNEMGISFSDYVMKKKMEKASEILRTTNEKVYKIAEIVGYKDASYFNRKFKEYYGATPLDYRMYSR